MIVVVYLSIDNHYKNSKTGETSGDFLEQVSIISDSDTDIGSEYSTDLVRVENKKSDNGKVEDILQIEVLVDETTHIKSKTKGNREEITHTLLKHYRTLTIFGIRFTWLGVNKLQRVGLVACNTYITDPLTKFCAMSVLFMIIAIINTFTKSYKDSNTNRVAILSYAANICIAFINLFRTVLLLFGCRINCVTYRDIALWYLSKVETVLLTYFPAVIIPTALLHVAVQKYRGKNKEE